MQIIQPIVNDVKRITLPRDGSAVEQVIIYDHTASYRASFGVQGGSDTTENDMQQELNHQFSVLRDKLLREVTRDQFTLALVKMDVPGLTTAQVRAIADNLADLEFI